MRKVFTNVYSLISVNTIKLYAGGFHSWVVLDDVNPKKDHFKPIRSPNSPDMDSQLNSNDELMNNFASQLDLGGKSYISN